MPAKVMLQVVKGKLAGGTYEFAERTSCIVGREKDCNLRLPNDDDHKFISRHHCLLDINPPDITVRDFGSLNGTHVNGNKIGQRAAGQTPEEGAKQIFPEHDLKQGDEVELGGTLFKVDIHVPAICQECSGEIPEGDRAAAQRSPGVYICNPCWLKAEREKRKLADKPKPRVCAKCGKDVCFEVGELRQGDYICAACKSDPFELVKLLLHLASKGQKDLFAINGFAILKELGKGGMGAVYLAQKEGAHQKVALKIMLPRVAADEVCKMKFLLEVENTKALKHANVVQLYESGCSNGTFFFTLEYCDLGCVDNLMKKRGGKLSVDEAAVIILQTLDGLEYAHNVEVDVELANGRTRRAKGLVHRDLKPANIFLCSAGGAPPTAKVADFGLAKAFDTAGLSGRTRTGTTAGTPFFMPRQQVVNFKYTKPDVDVWATAASFYNMITGAFPRDFRLGKDVWQTVLQSDPVPIRKRNSSIPKALAEVLDLALADRKGLHFQSAAQFKKALKGVL